MFEQSPKLAEVLATHRSGDAEATHKLISVVYEKLRVLAHRYMKRENGYHTLQPTALVNEACVRVLATKAPGWRGKTHLFAVAATQMRRILVEHARAARTKKRGGRPAGITLDENVAPTVDRTVELLALDEALRRLERRSRRQSQVCELRLFAGMLVTEVAEVLGVSDKTVKRDWQLARAWLARELSRERPHGETS